MYNTTQINVDTKFKEHQFKRDYFAHFFRWTHVVKRAKIGMHILDVGSGSANLLEVMYRNRYKPERYVGLEYKQTMVNKNKKNWSELDYAEFVQHDITTPFPVKDDWDMITCFEVLEHVGKHNVPQVLKNIKSVMSKKTILLLSTPCYDARVGAPKNHMIDGEVGELTYNELEDLVNNTGFKTTNVWGTFASQKDYKHLLNEEQLKMFNSLNEYFDSNFLSNFFAPLFPKQSRNCLWELRL